MNDDNPAGDAGPTRATVIGDICERVTERPQVDRGVSFTVGYVLTIAIAVVLITGVVFSVGQVVADQRSETIRSGAAVVGDQTAAAVMEVDRLVQDGGGQTNVSIALRLPDRLAGQPYIVALRGNDTSAFVVVRTEDPSVSVTTPLTNRTRLESTTVTGGDIRVVHRASEGRVTLTGDGS